MGALASPFAAAKTAMTNSAARTNNSAGLTAGQDALARGQGIAAGQQSAANQTAFANDAQQQEAQAQQGLAGIYGINQDTMAKLYGLGPGTLQARAAGPSGDQTAMSWLQTIGQGIGRV